MPDLKAQQPVAPRQASEPPAAGRRFPGTLRGGIVAVGAETTGWVLETEDGRVDVDVSKVLGAAEKLDGSRVVIEGAMVTATWVERGAKELLLADSMAPADEGK